MVKVEIFRHQSHATLSEKINKFIEDKQLEPEAIHDIKLAAGPENQIIAMVVYMDNQDFDSDNEESDEYIFVRRK